MEAVIPRKPVTLLVMVRISVWNLFTLARVSWHNNKFIFEAEHTRMDQKKIYDPWDKYQTGIKLETKHATYQKLANVVQENNIYVHSLEIVIFDM